MVVDDSVLMREMIAENLEAAGLEIVGKARDGNQALEIAKAERPDVITLDIQMPGMDGLQTLDQLLLVHPVPVIMVSSLTQRGAQITLDALDRGALDYVAKPEGTAAARQVLGDELVRKVRSMAGTDVARIMQIRRDRVNRRAVAPTKPALHAGGASKPGDTPVEYADRCIAIGISTGGPPALSYLFENLQPPLPPIVVVQHMPPHFTGPFAWRLNSNSRLNIKEAETGDVLVPNQVLIARGGVHLQLRRDGNVVKALLRDGDPVSGHRPSIDVMMKCAAEIYGNRVLGVIMTGMGRDGADGCGLIRAAGGYVLGQDEATSDVYGMNKAAFNEGHVDAQFALREGPAVLARQVKRLWLRAAVGV
ncbi:MAG: chemotaxis response regulator protein-glutamate methylesterase [Pirellulales bacterium]|nr:chemotaxis response regulator protein-glutamate methylesterase [Pirellulales bacterium]